MGLTRREFLKTSAVVAGIAAGTLPTGNALPLEIFGETELVSEKVTTMTKKEKLENNFKNTYTTGPFLLPQNTRSIDWGILNNDPIQQKIRVTVFKCNLGSTKSIEPPGPLEITLEPGEASHNANNAAGGIFYEIQVECNSKFVFPYACAWPGMIGDPIPGSVIKSAEFIIKLP